MTNEPIHIKFKNNQNPLAGLDIIRLEQLLNRDDLNHSPFELHLVNFYIIILVESGQGAHTIDFTKYPYEQGSIITVRKDQLHKFHFHEDVKGTILLFTDDFLVSYLEELETLKSLQLFNELLGVPKLQLSWVDFKSIVDLVGRLEDEYFDQNDAYSLGIIRSELHILIAKLFRIKSKTSPLITQRKYISEFISLQNLVEKHVTQHSKVQDYARMLGVSSKTLNNVTKQIINQTAKEFIDDIYTKQIKRLLINTDDPIKEIAYATGFEETTNFYKYFKRQTQLTPEQFRINYR